MTFATSMALATNLRGSPRSLSSVLRLYAPFECIHEHVTLKEENLCSGRPEAHR